MTRAWADDESGNINFDFLVGIVVFLGAFLYLINAIPGIFIPYQTNAVDLSSVAYRTSSILAEDPGWWQKDMNTYYTDWEEPANIDYATRFGLCVDKRTPNVLSYNKIRALNKTAHDNYLRSRNLTGLVGTMNYNYSLVINQTLSKGKQDTVLNISNNITSNRIESLDRMVVIRYGEGLYFDCYNTHADDKSVNGEGECLLRMERYPSFGEGNISIRITNFTGSILNESLTVAYFMGPDHSDDSQLIDAQYNYIADPAQANMSQQYMIFKTNDNVRYKYVDYPDLESYLPTDIIDIVINGTKLNNTAWSYGMMNVSEIVIIAHPDNTDSFLPDYVQNYEYTNTEYRYFDYPGMMKLRVWET